MANLNPGPQISDLLHSNSEHKAAYLFNHSSELDTTLTIRRNDMDFWINIVPNLSVNVKYFVKQAGFGGILLVGNRKIDHALITALVERWRPETHTFHFPRIGEATVTLQDVQVLWGLRISGDVVTGNTEHMLVDGYIHKCEQFMGFTPSPSDIKQGGIKLSCLYNQLLEPLPSQCSVDDYIKKARVCIMHLLGGTLLPNTSGNLVYLHHLDNLEDLEECGKLSWGSAVLACLYRRLCNATKVNAKDVGGALGLLQLWAWERIRSLAPNLVTENFHCQVPYGARYVYI